MIALSFYFLEGGSCLFTVQILAFHIIQQIALQAGKGNEDTRIFVKVDENEFLIHFQMTNTLTIVLICCLIRNLSYYAPRKPETSPYRLQIQQARERISYLFLFCISTKKEARYQFLFLNCLSCLCPHQALLLKKVNKWCYCCNIDYLWYFLCPLGIIHIIIGVPDDESDEEVPLAIPLYPNADGICSVVHNSCCFRVKNDLLLSSISTDSTLQLIFGLCYDYSPCFYSWN